MVCATAVLSSSLALSLLRHSSSPNESFVFSPFSLNSALSIVHNGASGKTQKELTNLLLNGCSSSDVTNHYSSLALSLPKNNKTGVSFTSANRFYVDRTIALKKNYQKAVEEKYKVKVQGINLREKEAAAKEMSKFVEDATKGKIKDMIKADDIDDTTLSFLINAINFLGNWKLPFNPKYTKSQNFKGVAGDRKMDFMNHDGQEFPVNFANDIGTALLLSYKDENYKLFLLMPKVSSNLEKLRNDLTGEKLVEVLKNAKNIRADITIPKFKIESDLHGVKVLKKMGVSSLFSSGADLSKISNIPLYVSHIAHKAVIEVNELGTEAAASTVASFGFLSLPAQLTFDRPFLYGILRNDDILFMGQLV